MSEWWTYRPSDFLMFSARSWGRLLEAWNRELWPLQAVLLAVALALLAWACARPHGARRPAILLLAAAGAWVGWAFHWERFADINTGARWFALASGVQALLLLAFALRDGGALPRRGVRIAGATIALLALVGSPLLAPLTGRGWAQAELFGAAPDPTALFTVGLLAVLPQRHRGLLLAIPLLALAVGWTTAWLLWAK